MTSIKVKFRRSAFADGKGSIDYQIIKDRKTGLIPTGYRLFPSEWDDKHNAVGIPKGNDREETVGDIRRHIRHDVERLVKIDRRFATDMTDYTAADIVAEFNRFRTEYSLFSYMEKIISKFRKNGKIRTSETYTATLRSFRRFRHNEDILLDCITPSLMEEYESWHRNRGISPNTSSFYARILRAVYNRAVESEIIENRYPFRHVYTGVAKTVKRALPLVVIKKIKTLELSASPGLDFARDMFLLSFFLRGMSFIDMSFLRKTDLRDGYVVYRRRKTGQRLTVEWTKEMQAILDKYPENHSIYLFPIIRRAGINERYAYRNVSYRVNYNLKKIGRMVGLTIPLTLYVARHSWASVAKAKGIPISVISEGMGHDSEATTHIYLSTLDTSLVDQANSLILRSLD